MRRRGALACQGQTEQFKQGQTWWGRLNSLLNSLLHDLFHDLLHDLLLFGSLSLGEHLLELRDSHRFGGIAGTRFRTLALVVTDLTTVTTGASLAIATRGLILLPRGILSLIFSPLSELISPPAWFVVQVVELMSGERTVERAVFGLPRVRISLVLMALTEELSIDLPTGALSSEPPLKPDASITPDFVVVGVNALGIRSLPGYTRFLGHSAFEIVDSLDELGIVKVTERSDILCEP